MSDSEIILYTSDDGAVNIQLRRDGDTVWLTQEQMATLFGRDRSVITKHIANIFAEGELEEESNVQNMHIAQSDKPVRLYRLDVALGVGYRVRSPRGTQFRRWATTALREYLIKGFVMNDERLKDPAHDYFEELLERIRDIRASEARFYQKVRDILSLSPDYDPATTSAQTFFATIQNKMLYAVTGQTAAELIVARADASLPNMGLSTWKGARVRKADTGVAKNYLAEKEIRELNLIVNIFLETATLRTERRRLIPLADWATILDDFIRSNEMPVLSNAGRISTERAKQVAQEQFESFDQARKDAERKVAADTDDLTELSKIADAAAGKRKTVRKKKNED
jgi:hypothetical protein